MGKRESMVLTKNLSALLARTQFGQVLERVSKNRERFIVTKKGEAKAVILGVEDFFSLLDEAPESLRELQKDAERSGANKMTFEEIEALIAEVRAEKRKEQQGA